MTYGEFNKMLDRINTIIKNARINEDDVEIGINDHEKRAFDISSISMNIGIENSEGNPEKIYIIIASE